MSVDCGSARDRLGRTLGGKYHLKQVLGAGGTAVVYRASTHDGEMVAIKVLHDHLSRSEEVCRRFVREGQIGNALEHPGVVRVLDHGSTEEGCPYLVLEYLDGESLEERRVRLGGRLELAETLDFCDQLLAVLEIAHAKNVVHRDVKPSNLFVMTDGKLKVLDFGIARLVDDTSVTATKTGQTVGTPAFMPPEQALSRPRDVDARTDIWSVGATLFTLLSGQHVHIAETSSEHLVKAATLHARSLARALRGVPANVEALVACALAFDKEGRWPSAAAMREELTNVRADPGRGIGTSTSPPPERTPSSPNMPTMIMSGSSARGAYSDAPTTYSQPRIPVGERLADSVEGMAMSSGPGAYDLFPGRRRWLLPFAIASTTLLVAMTIVVLLLVFRTPAPPAPAVAAAPPAASASPVLDLDDPAPGPSVALVERDVPPAPTPVVAPPASTVPVAVAPLPKAAVFAPPPSPPPSAKKPTTPATRKDVYRPF